jgi:hypothetical protein
MKARDIVRVGHSALMEPKAARQGLICGSLSDKSAPSSENE